MALGFQLSWPLDIHRLRETASGRPHHDTVRQEGLGKAHPTSARWVFSCRGRRAGLQWRPPRGGGPTMSSRRTATAAPAVGLILACAGSAGAQQDHATPQEVVQRVQQAAQAIAKQGEAGLAIYSSKNDISVWKDSYVFVVNCEGGAAGTVAPPGRLGVQGQGAAPTPKNGPRA